MVRLDICFTNDMPFWPFLVVYLTSKYSINHLFKDIYNNKKNLPFLIAKYIHSLSICGLIVSVIVKQSNKLDV